MENLIFHTVLNVKESLEEYRHSKNIFKRIYRYFTIKSLFKTISKSVRVIDLDIDFLSEYAEFLLNKHLSSESHIFTNESIIIINPHKRNQIKIQVNRRTKEIRIYYYIIDNKIINMSRIFNEKIVHLNNKNISIDSIKEYILSDIEEYIWR